MRIRLALLGVWLGVGLASAATLRPSMIVYGVVRDSYGIRLSADAATVSAFLGTNEVARTTTKVQPAGANYRFEVNVSDPLTAGANEVTPGAVVTLRVKMGGTVQPTIGTNTLVAQGNGAVVNLNLVLGVDSDGDGLPDDWERMVIANSGGQASSLTQVGPGHDLDGDGMAVDQEFWYGSFAFLPGDELRMNSLTRHENGRFSFTFTPVQGATYWVETASSLEGPGWSVIPVAFTETGDLSEYEFTGGDFTLGAQVLTIFFEPLGPAHFYRLRSR
jgi:hypothetical protein